MFPDSTRPAREQLVLGKLVTLKAIHKVWSSPGAAVSAAGEGKAKRRKSHRSSRDSQRDIHADDNGEDSEGSGFPDTEHPIFGQRWKRDSSGREEESRHVEFKSLTRTPNPIPRLLDLVEKYTNAFLNSEGGELYFGVEDDGTVHGLLLDTKDRDQIRIGVDGLMQHSTPTVDTRSYSLDFLPVLEELGLGYRPIEMTDKHGLFVFPDPVCSSSFRGRLIQLPPPLPVPFSSLLSRFQANSSARSDIGTTESGCPGLLQQDRSKLDSKRWECF